MFNQSDPGKFYNTYQSIVSVSTAGSTWNGSSWVSSAPIQPTIPLPSTELPKIPPHMTMFDKSAATARELVTFYSEIYAYYSAQLAACKTAGDNSSSAYQWADYYSDLSSRAAHHYNIFATKEQSQTQPTNNSTSTSTQGGSKVNNYTKNSVTTTQAAQHDAAPPKSFQDYAHRCLSQCYTDTQKTAMKELIQMTIKKHIKDGSMQHTNWNHEPLLPMPNHNNNLNTNGKTYANAVSNNSSSNRQNNDNTVKNNSSSNWSTTYDNALPTNDSYYGQSASAATTTADKSKNSGLTRSSSSSKRKWKNEDEEGKTSPASHQKRVQDLPANDSYYGSPGSKNDAYHVSPESRYKNSMITTMELSQNKKKKKSSETRSKILQTQIKEVKSLPMNTDFISLSSLSSEKYVKKNNKLVKVTSNTSTGVKKKGKKNKKNINGFNASAKTMASRASRFSGQGGINDASSSDLHSEYKNDIDRYMGKTVIGGKNKLSESDYEKMTVKGRCKVLEKEFLRLTAPPKAELVRPQKILQRHLSNLKLLWKNTKSGKIGSDKRKDYNWFCSQLKAVRQDLTVQRIASSFTIDAYEAHARIALEEGDLNEYNQSQTKLKEFYKVLSSKSEGRSALENENEFIAYRIIYHVLLTGNKKYDGGSTDIYKIMLDLTPEQREDPFVCHALKVRVAVADNDYHAFFRLQDECPNLGAYLMDTMVPQMRTFALRCMMKAYLPTLPVKFILEELGFIFKGVIDLEEGIGWLKGCGCKLNDEKTLVLTRDTVLNESAGQKTSSLI